jgi:hypothetical protein
LTRAISRRSSGRSATERWSGDRGGGHRRGRWSHVDEFAALQRPRTGVHLWSTRSPRARSGLDRSISRAGEELTGCPSRFKRTYTDLQGFMARGGVEPPTPRFSVKEMEAMVWAVLQGLSRPGPRMSCRWFPAVSGGFGSPATSHEQRLRGSLEWRPQLASGGDSCRPQCWVSSRGAVLARQPGAPVRLLARGRRRQPSMCHRSCSSSEGAASAGHPWRQKPDDTRV